MRTVVLLVLLAGTSSTWAFTYTLTCSKSGELLEFSSAKKQKDCAYFTKQGLTCGDSFTASADHTRIALRSPLDTYYSSRDSRNYDREIIKKAIRVAVENGIDPYLLVAMVLVESPPFSSLNISYLEMYGLPPLDAVAYAAAMKCHTQPGHNFGVWTAQEGVLEELKVAGLRPVKKFKAGEKIEYRSGDAEFSEEAHDRDVFLVEAITPEPELVGGKNDLELSLFGSNVHNGRAYVLELPGIEIGQQPFAKFPSLDYPKIQDCKDACCATVYLPKEWSEDQFYEARVDEQIEAQLGSRFIREKMASAAKLGFVRAKKNPYERMAAQIQAYNGYGKLGSTEEVSNTCLKGLNTKSSPIYGAGVGELMLNAVMANSEVRALVTEAVRSTHAPAVHSLLCEGLGEGATQVDARAFAAVQSRILSGRACGGHSYTFKSRNTLPAAAAAAAESTE